MDQWGAGPGLPRGPGRSLVDNETESTLRAVVINASLELSETRVRHAVFLPEAVLERVEHLEQLAAALLSPSWEVAGAGEEDPVRIYHKDPMFTFTIAQLELFNEIREQVGTDRLSESMRSLLRAPRTPQPE